MKSFHCLLLASFCVLFSCQKKKAENHLANNWTVDSEKSFVVVDGKASTNLKLSGSVLLKEDGTGTWNLLLESEEETWTYDKTINEWEVITYNKTADNSGDGMWSRNHNYQMHINDLLFQLYFGDDEKNKSSASQTNIRVYGEVFTEHKEFGRLGLFLSR